MRKRRKFVFVSAIILLVAAGVLVNRLAAAKRWAQSRSCVGNMSAICLAGRLWANDNGDHMPTNFICMSNELVTPKILRCPGDNQRVRATNWETFAAANCSYMMVTPGAQDGDTNAVFIRCTVHGIRGLADGSIFDGTRRRQKFE